MSKSKLMAAATLLMLSANPALAYVGPGAGLSAIGSIFAFFGVILLMIVGFFWYPVKRMLSGNKAGAAEQEMDAE